MHRTDLQVHTWLEICLIWDSGTLGNLRRELRPDRFPTKCGPGDQFCAFKGPVHKPEDKVLDSDRRGIFSKNPAKVVTRHVLEHDNLHAIES